MSEMTAADVMSHPVITVPGDADLERVGRIMLEKEIGSLVVVDDEDAMIGIVTDSDFAARKSKIPFSTFELPQVLGRWMDDMGVEEIYRRARSMAVSEIMTRRVWSVEREAPIAEVVRVMLNHDIDHVPVVVGDRPVGMVAHRDLLKLLLESG